MKLIESFDEFLNERKINAPKNGFKKLDIEKILKTNKDISLYSDTMKQYFYITPYMHINGKIHDTDGQILIVLDGNGRKVTIKYSDISYILI